MLGFEFVVHYSLHQAGLADSSVTNNDKLEKMVVLGQGLVSNDIVLHFLKLVDLRLLHLILSNL